MQSRIYNSVQHREMIDMAIDFGEGWIDLKPNPFLNTENITINVYSIGHPTSKGMTSFYGKQCRISIYTGSIDGINSVLETIFHELFHVKQFCSKEMSLDPYDVEMDEAQATFHAQLMLRKFLEFYDNKVDK